MIPEEKIIKGCQSGKHKCQTQLYRRFAPAMLGVCMRYAPDRSSAEDILQEGFIKVYTYIQKFRGEGSFEGWIRRIMVNTAISWIKEQRKNGYTEDIDAIQERIPDNDESNETEDQRFERLNPEELMDLIQQLPDGYRMVLNLYVFEGNTHKEIADYLDISENTSKSQLSKARRYLRKLVREKEIEKQYIPVLR